jgi:hypothetical protein
MELRLVTTEAERRAFTEGLEEARATNAAGFKEKRGSRMGDVHITYGRLYGLFDEDGPDPSQMLAGGSMHDLASFSQSFYVPNLSHLPPETVFELGEHWSRVKGAGLLARVGLVVALGLAQAQAAVCYPIVKPWDLTEMYSKARFDFVGEPVDWPWAETLDGGKIWVQPVVSEGVRLRRMIRLAWSAGFQTFDQHRVIKFANPYPVRPVLSKEAAVRAGEGGRETNGAAPA